MEPSTLNVTIGVGRNIGPTPMPDQAWLLFRAELRACLTELAADVHGWTTESAWGREQSYWVARSSLSLPALEARLVDLAGRYQQEAIALTVGTTLLVRPAPVRLPQAVRP